MLEVKYSYKYWAAGIVVKSLENKVCGIWNRYVSMLVHVIPSPQTEADFPISKKKKKIDIFSTFTEKDE